jgi:hypothetical protein
VTARRALATLALVIGLAHLPFLASSLEDIDSVNFALGVRDFDVADHRPHPPGYPAYIAAGKAVAAVVGALPGSRPASTVEARSLSLLSLAAASGVVFVLFRVFAAPARVRAVGAPPWTRLDVPALAALALTMTCPLVWTLAVRPMSDLPGLAVVVAAQACLASAWWWQTPAPDGDRRLTPEAVAASGRMIVLGAFVAGLAIGVRSQTLWLAVPLLLAVLADRIGRGVAGAMIGAGMTFTIGVLAWLLPLLVASGGPAAYLVAFGSQAGEDIVGGEMLYLNPTPRLAVAALIHTFVDPWEHVALATAVLVLAALGVGRLLRLDRRTLVLVTVATGPYLGFHLLFQDTSFTRYAAPLIPAVAYLATHGLALLSVRAIPVGATVLSSAAVVVGTSILVEYARTPAPAVQAVALVNGAARTEPPSALGLHQTFQRPLEAEVVTVGPQLPSPPRREWLELARFWTTAGPEPVWFLSDPRRTDLALVDPQSRRDVTEIRWAAASRRVFGGLRPAAADWIRLAPPRWFAEEGWALTPETGGMARLMGRAPHLGAITARVRREPGEMRLLIGGRNLAGPTDPVVRFAVAVDGRPLTAWETPPGFFLQTLRVPAGDLNGDGPWAALTVQATPVAGDAPLAASIEQFDLQTPDTLMWAFDEGWHEAEYSPALGIWHWTSARARLRILGATSAVRVAMEIESPLRYFAQPSRVRALAGAAELSASTVTASQSWSFDVPADVLAAAGGVVLIETSQTFTPAERGGPPDRRALGLRVFRVSVNAHGLR